MFEICSFLSKTGLKIYYFCQHSKKANKWANDQTILFLANSFKKGQNWQIWPLKRPNGNPAPRDPIIVAVVDRAFNCVIRIEIVTYNSGRQVDRWSLAQESNTDTNTDTNTNRGNILDIGTL